MAYKDQAVTEIQTYLYAWFLSNFSFTQNNVALEIKFPRMSAAALQWPFSGAVKQSARYLTALFVSLATCLLILESYCHVLQQSFFAFLKQLHDLRVWSSFLLIGIVYRNRTQVGSTAH